MSGSHFPNFPVPQRRVNAKMVKGQPIQGLQSKMQSDIIIEGMFGVKLIIQFFADLQLNVLFKPILILQQNGIITLISPDEISDVLYKIKEDLLDTNIVINCIEPFLHLR